MDVLEVFRRQGALLQGHFLLSSGLHSPAYLQSALVLQHPSLAEEMGTMLARQIRTQVAAPDFVVSPAMGGLIIGHEVARALQTPFRFVERENGVFALRRGFAIEPSSTCVVIEDVITTGRSTREVVDLVSRLGATTAAVGCLIDRTGGANSLSIAGRTLSLLSLAQLSIPTFDPPSCPLCAAGSTPVKPGSRPSP
jgi:orotate phosphoribosyltransferase